MTSSLPDITESANMHMPVALIQTQDLAFIESLREYLSRHGCQTIVNNHTEKKITYHVVVGDEVYVKGIVASTRIHGEKTLVIIYEGGQDDVSLYLSQHINVAIIDAHPLDEKDLRSLLLLLFTGSARSLITRKEQNLRRLQSVVKPPLPREPVKSIVEDDTDRARVSEIMQQVFKPVGQKKLRRGSALSRVKNAILIATIFVLVFFVSYTASLTTAGIGLYVTAKLIASSNTTLAMKTLYFADSSIETARMFVRISAPVGKLVGADEIITTNERLVLLFENMSSAEKSVQRIFLSGKGVITDIFSSKDANHQNASLADVIGLRSDVVELDQNLALVQTELSTLIDAQSMPFAIPTVLQSAKKVLAKIQDGRVKLSYFDRLFTLYPQLAGYRKKQTYLVLLQNSMELRPTGGFIGSVALVTFLDGAVSDVEVQDVYTADGQLKGHIDPPIAIREILGQEHWYLRDSNWDPNFIHAGAQAAWFYEKEMGVSVDGVIGISVPFITKLLDVTGPIELPDYKEHISSSNFFAKSILYTQTDFFPGSTQKKDFLGSLTSALLSRITTGNAVPINALFSAITNGLDAKDIQFYIPNNEISAVLQQWGWSGGIGSTACLEIEKGAPCVSEHVEVVEANLGVNKVNYFVSRLASSDITISDAGTIDHVLSYSIKNASSAQILEGGGVYRTYIRAYFPQYTNLTHLSLDGIEIPAKQTKPKTPQQAPYYEVLSEGDKMVVGMYVSIDPLSTKQIEIHTTRLSALSFSHKASLSVIIGKQAGIESIPWNMNIRYPAGWTATSEAPIAKQGELEYNTSLGKNYKMSIVFEKTL